MNISDLKPTKTIKRAAEIIRIIGTNVTASHNSASNVASFSYKSKNSDYVVFTSMSKERFLTYCAEILVNEIESTRGLN